MVEAKRSKRKRNKTQAKQNATTTTTTTTTNTYNGTRRNHTGTISEEFRCIFIQWSDVQRDRCTV